MYVVCVCVCMCVCVCVRACVCVCVFEVSLSTECQYCVFQYGTMILVMEDLTSYMRCRPRFWLNLLNVLEATLIGDTPSSVLLV